MTHCSACCYFPSTKTIQLQRKGQPLLAHRLSAGARGRGQCLGCLVIKERRSRGLLAILLSNKASSPACSSSPRHWRAKLGCPRDGGDAVPVGRAAGGLWLNSAAWSSSPRIQWSNRAFPCFQFKQLPLELPAMNCACNRGTIRSQRQPGEGTEGMNRVSRPLRMKKIPDGRNAVLS